MAENRFNVMVIVLDSVRSDHLSCYGYGRPTTPHVDRIAGEGVRFDRAYATSCWTLPSHASLFTGRYPWQHHVDLDRQTLGPEHETMAGFLRERGYATASFSCNGFVTKHTELTRGFDLSADVEGMREGRDPVSRLIRFAQWYWKKWTARDRGARRATRSILEWLDARDRDRPFFLFVNYMDCHLPYALRGAARHRFLDRADRKRAAALPLDPFGVMAGAVPFAEKDVELLKSLYDGCLRYLDSHVGAIDGRLREEGIDDRTLFVVTSDHGESFGEHGLFDHQYGLYEELVRVPLILRLPGRERAGEVSSRLVQLVDLFPTVAELLGEEWSGSGDPAPRSVFSSGPRAAALAEYLVPNVRAIRRRFPDADVSAYDRGLRALIEERYKLILAEDGGTELYDLAADPGETRDVSEARPEVTAELRRRLEGIGAPWGSREAAGDETDMELLRERLEALGYL